MKIVMNIALLSVVVLMFTGCTKVDVPTSADVAFVLDHSVDQNQLEGNTPFTYTNQAGNPYNVSSLKYVISNVVLIDQSFNEIALNNNDLIDGLGSGRFSASALPNGTYKSMRFTISSFIHQGKFLDGSNAEQPINIDYTAGGNEQEITMPVGGLTVNGAAKTAYIVFNLNAVYDANTDFNAGATQASVAPTFSGAFSFAGSSENK